MSYMFSALHHSDIPCSKRERLFRVISRHPGKGSNPKESSGRGSNPNQAGGENGRELLFSIDVKGGEIVTLM
jgi:hypothetical protein